MKYDVHSIYPDRSVKLPLLYKTTQNGRYNLDGLFTYSQIDAGKHSAYTQFYREGIIEAVDSRLLVPREQEGVTLKIMPDVTFEKKLILATDKYLNLMTELSIEPPIFIFLSILNGKGYRITTRNPFEPYSTDSIDRDMLLLPAEIIEEYGTAPGTILKPMFDLIWNSCGISQSINYDEDGNWIERR